MISPKIIIQKALNQFGYIINKYDRDGLNIPKDFDPDVSEIARAVAPYTMTSPLAVNALVKSVEYVIRSGIPGSIVECGVWRGGSTMAALKKLVTLGKTDRDCYLFDTFEGMSTPTEHDLSKFDGDAFKHFNRLKTSEDSSDWCYAGLGEVQRNVKSTGYPEEHLHFVKGKVEDTLPHGYAGGPIALLRLDTDWYESTLHEMNHLFPLLSDGGVLIIDDYGHWEGCRKAITEYFENRGTAPLLTRIDYSVRLLVKNNSVISATRPFSSLLRHPARR